jgi:hypothetical protein
LRTWLDGLLSLTTAQGSQGLYEVLFRPTLRVVLEGVTSSLGSHVDDEDGMIAWIDFVLRVVYNVAWVIPVYLLSKVINALWYQVCR